MVVVAELWEGNSRNKAPDPWIASGGCWIPLFSEALRNSSLQSWAAPLTLSGLPHVFMTCVLQSWHSRETANSQTASLVGLYLRPCHSTQIVSEHEIIRTPESLDVVFWFVRRLMILSIFRLPNLSVFLNCLLQSLDCHKIPRTSFAFLPATRKGFSYAFLEDVKEQHSRAYESTPGVKVKSPTLGLFIWVMGIRGKKHSKFICEFSNYSHCLSKANEPRTHRPYLYRYQWRHRPVKSQKVTGWGRGFSSHGDHGVYNLIILKLSTIISVTFIYFK